MAEQIIRDVFLANRMSWLLLMVLFIGGSFAAQSMAQARRSVGMQYAGLALYVLLYTLLFLPILTIASDPEVWHRRSASAAPGWHRDAGGLRRL